MLLLRCQPGKLNGLAEHQLGSDGAGNAAETPNCWQGITTQGAGVRDICRERTDRPKVDRPPNRHLRTKVFHPPGELCGDFR